MRLAWGYSGDISTALGPSQGQITGHTYGLHLTYLGQWIPTLLAVICREASSRRDSLRELGAMSFTELEGPNLITQRLQALLMKQRT